MGQMFPRWHSPHSRHSSATSSERSTATKSAPQMMALATCSAWAIPPEAERVTVVAEKVRSGSGRNAKLIEQINTLFKEGMEHYVAGRPGNPNSNMHLSKAAKLFDNVVGLCDKALKNEPGNSQLESRQADASRYAYHARKMKTLSLF